VEGVSEGRAVLVVGLPLPGVALQPNRPQHYMARAEAKRLARFEAHCEALQAMREQHPAFVHSPVGSHLFGPCRATVQVTWPDRRRRDLDNLLASTKAYWDGFTDAGVWRDDSLVTWILPPARVDKQAAGVVVTIEPIAEGDD
jgi:Holliday junction resolvase RusA-like endonuclease